MEVVRESSLELQPSIRRLHHEFKNNLQTVCSLIRLFSTALDSEGRRVLKRIEGSVHSMGSMYESLDKTGADFSRVLVDDYLFAILIKLLKAFGYKEVVPRPPLEKPSLFVESRVACQLGLFFNEILVHVLSGYPENKGIDRASLDIKVGKDAVQIEVDFGDTGFSEPESTHISEKKILNALAAQVEAVIVWPWESGKGSVSILIPTSILSV